MSQLHKLGGMHLYEETCVFNFDLLITVMLVGSIAFANTVGYSGVPIPIFQGEFVAATGTKTATGSAVSNYYAGTPSSMKFWFQINWRNKYGQWIWSDMTSKVIQPIDNWHYYTLNEQVQAGTAIRLKAQGIQYNILIDACYGIAVFN